MAWAHLWKTLGDAVQSITNIYSLYLTYDSAEADGGGGAWYPEYLLPPGPLAREQGAGRLGVDAVLVRQRVSHVTRVGLRFLLK